MKYFALAFVILFYALPAAADDMPQQSLFLSPQQTRDAEKLADQSLPAGAAGIHLGAIIYYDRNDWTLWLQHKRWTPQTHEDGLKILDVTPASAELLWRDDNGDERDITLRDGETYQIATGQITAR
ncbi:MAG: hypothetical protein KGI37_04535 [Alphaproteobacteria bacterium]|nr:hypothetical protein [Alphaproteobacteria bacterium]